MITAVDILSFFVQRGPIVAGGVGLGSCMVTAHLVACGLNQRPEWTRSLQRYYPLPREHAAAATNETVGFMVGGAIVPLTEQILLKRTILPLRPMLAVRSLTARRMRDES